MAQSEPKNTLKDFQRFCSDKGLFLTDAQFKVAYEMFKLPRGGGKSVLIYMLNAYDQPNNPLA